ncbi:MAG: diaminopimelate decarboxylase [Clostridiales bacterium]|nr:diaminopimelate decarboxylase [Candidatus Crickella merdequi]
MKKVTPFTLNDVQRWAEDYPTPFYVYDEEGIRECVEAVYDAFSWNEGFREFFAVKACPTPAILRLLESLGCGADCASVPEIVMAQCSGMTENKIVFSSNETTYDEYRAAVQAGAIINLDDLTQVDVLEKAVGYIPEAVCCRYNPGQWETTNEFMGNLYDSKFGMPEDQLFEALRLLKDKGAKKFGIHAMLASCCISNEYYPALARELFALALKIREELEITLDFIDLSGGVGIPYRPSEEPVDIAAIGEGVRKAYDEILKANGIELSIYTEMGRYITGPYGYLVTKVIGKKHIYKEYIGVDATASCLMRPAIYGSYHHMTVLGKEDEAVAGTFDVVGSLCENNDKFAVDRELPEIELGDYIVIHDAGAHGHSMGYTYNGKLRPAEFMKRDGALKMIRRAQTMDDYFRVLDCDEEFMEARR